MYIANVKMFLFLIIILYLIGVLGLIFNRKNIIITLMSIELMLLSVNLNFLLFSIYLDDMLGQLFILFVLTIAAVESVIGLSILFLYFKLRNTITFEKIKSTKN